METINDRWPSSFEKSFRDSISICNWNSFLLKNDVFFRYEISLSFVYSDELINSTIFFIVTTLGLNVIEIVDLIDVDDTYTKYSDTEMI